MDAIKVPYLEKREVGKDIILLAGYGLSGKEGNPLTAGVIEPGTNVWLKYRGRKIGVKITKAAGNDFVGKILHLENPPEASEGLSRGDFIKFQEENIFGYAPPA